MAKFCGKCGTKIDQSTGLCPKCDSEKLKKADDYNHSFRSDEEGDYSSISGLSKKEMRKFKKREKRALKKAAKKAKRENWSLGRKIRRFFLKLIIVMILLAILVAGSIGTLVYLDIVNIPVVEDILKKTGIKSNEYQKLADEDINYENYAVEPPDADEYFQNNSQVEKIVNINDSDAVLTEAEAKDMLEERGFTEYPVTTEYDMDGIYYEAIEISGTSNIKHPVYDTYYVTENNELWSISVIDGDIVAIPVSYNLQSSLEVQIVISESGTVTSYDSTTNNFYKNIPNENIMIVKVVERIDAKTLEKLTIEVIDTL